jgi:hypothetical protein
MNLSSRQSAGACDGSNGCRRAKDHDPGYDISRGQRSAKGREGANVVLHRRAHLVKPAGRGAAQTQGAIQARKPPGVITVVTAEGVLKTVVVNTVTRVSTVGHS